MADSTRAQIEQAYKLIEEEKLDQAVAILRQVVATQPNSIDAWWLMANAVSEPEDAHEALSNVLRLNPHHIEAREAYDQLIAEYPEFAPQAAPPAPEASGDFSPDISVDIDDLLRRTGTLDPRRSDPMTRPEGAEDVSAAYLDDLWTTREPGEEQTSALDLDALFGGRESIDVPVTPTEEADLDALFRGEAFTAGAEEALDEAALEDLLFSEETLATDVAEEDQVSADLKAFFGAASEEVEEVEQPGADLESLFGTTQEEAEPAAPLHEGLDDLFGEAPGEVEPAVAASPPELEDFFASESTGAEEVHFTEEESLADLDEFFKEAALPTEATVPGMATGAFADDPFAVEAPGFVQAMEAEPAAGPVQPAEKRRRREGRPPPTPVVPEAPPPDPLAAERRVNRRSPLRVLVALLVVVAVLAVAILLAVQVVAPPGPDPVALAVAATTRNLADSGFGEVSASSDGKTLRVVVCALAGPQLQARVYAAMDLIAVQVAVARESFTAAQIQVNTCGRADQVLYRAAAPIDAVTRYIDGDRADVRAYRASWQPN